MYLKIASLTEKKRMESSEETHRTPHVVCPTESNENYVVRHRSNHMVKLCDRRRELRHSSLSRCCIVTLIQPVVKAGLK